MDTVERSRRGLAIFFAALILLSIPVQWNIIHNGLSVITALPFFWTPCMASLLARRLMREGFKDISLGFGRKTLKPLLIAWLYPLMVGAFAYGTAWLTGIAELTPLTEHVTGIPIPGKTTAGLLVAGAFVSLTVGTSLNMALATGEEIGWRGYMLTRLIDARVPRPVLVSGLIWGSWHLPLILAGRYLPSPHPVLSSSLFMASMIALSYLMAHLRLEAGSVWPAAVLHASWNELILLFFDSSTRGPAAVYWLSESGILVAACAALFTAVLIQGRWRFFRHPADSSPRDLSTVGL